MPAAFWSLTVREFWIKHDAFMREQDRRLYLLAWQAWKTTTYKPKAKHPEEIIGRVLTRYPEKPWLK